jgi:protein-tyrosine phosphatase
MRDIHNHLLYGIDDGAKTIEDSERLLKEMEDNHITDIMFTPHYIIGSQYNANNAKKKKLLNELKKKTKINLYYGNEVYIDNDIVPYIEKGEIASLNDSRYILVEFPLNEKLDCAFTLIQNVIKCGYVPIIAHPERYHYYDIQFFIDLIKEGCLLQGNITSLCGKYGKEAKHNLELLVKKNMIHFMGTDTHMDVFPLNECYEALSSIVSKEMYKDITANNFLKVVNNKKIVPYEINNNKAFNLLGFNKIK